MSNNSYSLLIPADLSARLRTLFRLSGYPKTLDELGVLINKSNQKCLKEPRLRAHFRAICKGKEIFGNVDYETRHRIALLDGGQVYVACALDALVEGFFLPIEIDSVCFHCGEPIRIRMSEGTINSVNPSSVVMWLGASRGGVGSCCEDVCPYINFFSSSEHVAEWKGKNPKELGIVLSLPQSLELARKGYWETLRLLEVKT